MDLRNSKLSGSAELFPADILERTVEKSSRVLHDEAIGKAVTVDKPARKLTKKLQFSQSSHQQQQPKRPLSLLRASPCSGLLL